MRILLSSVVLIHGLIHLLGPAKAFGWAGVEALRVPVSRTAGTLWLLTAVLFLGAAVVLAMYAPSFPGREWWWAPALAAVALSQALIISAWGDARFGTLANVIIVIPALVAMLAALPGSYPSEYRREAAARVAPDAKTWTTLVTEADLAALPAPVQRYLRAVGVVGRPRVRGFHIAFRGGLRSGPDGGWMASVADQHTTFGPDRRLFIVHATLYGVPFDALHIFKDAAATMRVKVASIAAVVDARGPEMDQSETVTFFNDMWLLAPASIVGAPIVWESIDANTVGAAFTHGTRTISARLSFGPDGLLTNFVSDDRYRSSDGKAYERLRWSTPISRWRTINGTLLPAQAEAAWTLPSGEFTYARFEITGVEYSVGGRDE